MRILIQRSGVIDQENDIKRTFDVFKKHSCSDFLRFYIVPHVFKHAESEDDLRFRSEISGTLRNSLHPE